MKTSFGQIQNRLVFQAVTLLAVCSLSAAARLLAQTNEPYLRLSLRTSNDSSFITIAGQWTNTFVIESSANLRTWEPLSTNTLAGGTLTVRHQHGPGATAQFYRAKLELPVVDWCATFDCFKPFYNLALSNAVGGCPIWGPPDQPAVRNASIPSSATPIKTMRVRVHVLANDDGSSPAASLDAVDRLMAEVNRHYLPWRIQFRHTMRVVNATRFRSVPPLSDADTGLLKQSLAEEPATQINLFITYLRPTFLGKVTGIGTFPWDHRALTDLGGVLLDEIAVWPGQTTLSHELGHCFGLWHTHHGVSEVASACEVCWERADGQHGDTTGDFCSDTPPTPRSWDCRAPGGVDTCSGVGWGQTDFGNFMGYSPCQDHFTPQQAGRMHAWITNRLANWLSELPAAPGNLAAVPAYAEEIALAWSDNSSSETGFRIERSTDGVNFSFLTIVGPNVRSCTDAGLGQGLRYWYRVQAVNGAGPSAFSAAVSAATSAAATIIYVDAAYRGPAPDGSASKPFPTVRQGYQLAGNGDILRIRAGAYSESYAMTKRLKLESTGGVSRIGAN